MADINEVAQEASEILTAYSSVLRAYYDVFYNPNPLDVTITMFDEQGDLNTFIVPNRAKDKTFLFHGTNTPEGTKQAPKGSLYQDTLNGDAYVKTDSSLNTGWKKVIDKTDIDAIVIQGNNSPEENVTATKGMLYVDILNGALYIKTTSSGNTGWRGYISQNQLDNLQEQVDNLKFIPEGTVMWYCKDTAPEGFLECNGAEISRTVYNNLYSVIGTTFGQGDGNLTFNLPDLRGEFIRGWDNTRGLDIGRVFGSQQSDAIKSHRHDIGFSDFNGTQYGNTTVANNHKEAGWGNANINQNSALTSFSGGNETRPINVALLPCIKY